MNSNLIRTLLTIGAAALVLLPVFLGCTLLESGSFDCSASILPPQFAGLGAMVLLALSMVIKAFDGTGLFSTSSTTFRTVLSILGFAVTAVTIFAGCSADAAGAITCTASWMSPTTGAFVATVLIGLNQVVKTFDGTTLTKPVVK